MSAEDEARGLIAAAESKGGRLDILVNNVGPILFRPWDRLTASDWESMFRENVLSAYFCLTAALPGSGPGVSAGSSTWAPGGSNSWPPFRRRFLTPSPRPAFFS